MKDFMTPQVAFSSCLSVVAGFMAELTIKREKLAKETGFRPGLNMLVLETKISTAGTILDLLKQIEQEAQ